MALAPSVYSPAARYDLMRHGRQFDRSRPTDASRAASGFIVFIVVLSNTSLAAWSDTIRTNHGYLTLMAVIKPSRSPFRINALVVALV